MTSKTISLDLTNLYGKEAHFIKGQTSEEVANDVDAAIQKVEQKLNQQGYGFVEAVNEDFYLQEIKQIYGQIKQKGWAKNLVVVGIGGSDLGARTVVEALGNKDEMTVLFVGDSTDPIAYARLLEKVNLEETVFNVISKSGGTLETLSGYVFFKGKMQEVVGENWREHFVFTTSANSGVLRKEADDERILTLSVPENVGGRFSVSTSVGLLPALAAGVDIDLLVKGAMDLVNDEDARIDIQSFARSQYELYKQDIKILVMMVYSVQLQEFARWFRQLWAESLGKDDQGILPVKAWGPADQHSQAQFYNQGSPLQSVLFLKVLNRKTDFVLNGIDVDAAQYLEGKSFGDLINVECDASAAALKSHGRPGAMMSVESLDAYSLGQLFMFFELAVVYVAEMLGVNAFDQPGVEEGKQIALEMLQR